MAGNVMEFTDANFEVEVVKSDLPVLVDFWAPWCGPCRMIAPSIEALSGEYAGKFKIGKLNTDDNADVSARFGIRSIPTLLIFKGGEVVDQLVGALPKEKIAERINKFV
ncbi:MAG: thioredoxin [Fibrobacteres bacterium]|jgi:thioredoxin 1|nr:thioredoxin [Fibrobacterota bacterium]